MMRTLLRRMARHMSTYKPLLIVVAATVVATGFYFESDIQRAFGQTYALTQTGYSWGGDFNCIGHRWNDCTWSCGPGYGGAGCSIGKCQGHQDGGGGNLGGGNLGVVWEVYSYTCTYTPPACTPDSSCAANTCSTSTCSDSCGNTYAGTKSCSVACTVSNACGASNTGTLSGGVCSASAPALPSGYGSSCTSAANSCGMTNTGTIGCSGSCSASAPSNALCAPAYSEASYAPVYSQSYYQSSYAPAYSEASYYAEGSYAPSCTSPAVSITANPSRVKSGQTSTLTVTGTGISSSCVVSGPGVNTTIPASSCTASQTITTPAITARSVYTVSCDSGATTAKVIVNLPFGILEF